MVGLLPTLADDELFYSGVARLSHALGVGSERKFYRAIFGRPIGVSISFDLPTKLDAWARMLPPNHPYTATTIIEEHTLFPYSAALVDPTKAAAVRALMLDARRRERVHARLGLLSRGSGWRRGLRYCALCTHRDRELFEVAIWRRLHQLPGVLMCIEHDRPLDVYLVAGSSDRSSFFRIY